MMKIIKCMFGWMKLKRKGITPVIAIVLLLMMTVAAAGVAYLWIMELQSGMEDTANKGVEKQRKDALAAITIESIWKDGTNSDIQLMIRNSGTYTFTATEIGQFIYYVDSVPIAPGTACVGLGEEGSTCTVDTDEAFPAAAGDEKVIMVKSPVGRSATRACRLQKVGDTSC
ncbi:MAG: archaellin/type IV pilin N-terminal domain-containing protein [archaeon]|nr:archaellin/type IV pilin N-terminal domain-containing protein [archaeon]